MAFVISSATRVTGLGGRGIISVNLSLVPQIQRLYDIGYTDPYDTNTIEQYQMTINRYAPGPTYLTLPTSGCDDANSLSISIDAVPCGDSDPVAFSDEFFVTSFSYSKDLQSFGQETWALTTKPSIGAGQGEYRMVRGITEGQKTPGSVGITLISSLITGRTVDVTAGSPGIGQVNDVTFGIVGSVGGGVGKLDGFQGNGSADIPYSPIPVVE